MTLVLFYLSSIVHTSDIQTIKKNMKFYSIECTHNSSIYPYPCMYANSKLQKKIHYIEASKHFLVYFIDIL